MLVSVRRVLNPGTADTLGCLNLCCWAAFLEHTPSCDNQNVSRQVTVQVKSMTQMPSVPPGAGHLHRQGQSHCFGGILCAFPLLPSDLGWHLSFPSSLVPKGQSVGWTRVVASTYSHENYPQGCHCSVPAKEKIDAKSTKGLWGPSSSA